MDKAYGKVTVYFEDPFWIGVVESTCDGMLSVAKITFGAEPKDYEIAAYLLKHYYDLRFSPAVATVCKDVKQNPKRRQREVKKQLIPAGIGTKSQQALKLQQEQFKQARKQRSREEKLAQATRKFELKQQKRLEKHKGH